MRHDDPWESFIPRSLATTVNHRTTIMVGDDLACDCGETFGSATELEFHQRTVQR